MPILPILYSFRRCPYAIRARLALLISGQGVELREVVLRAKPDAMLHASPKGTVPVLVLPNGQVIDQSLDIMRWALAASDPEGWLTRRDDALIAANDGPFKHHLDRTKYPDRHGSDPATHREQALALLQGLDARLRDSDQLCGARRGLTDMAIFPFVRQFAAIDPPWFAAQPVPALRRWLAGHLKSDLFAQAMRRVSPWRESDTPKPFRHDT
ncbi:glutathione S-transferase [Sphingobium sp.]|uniref:glutathione S-transferase n=1 Tax=Sphingobium sp. TaxID=1912891 RepID=UPI003BB50478